MHFTFFPSLTEPVGEDADIAWESFVSFVCSPQIAASKDTLEGWSPVKFRSNTRLGENVEFVSAIALDDDSSLLPTARLAELCGGYVAAVHTTFRHTAQPPT